MLDFEREDIRALLLDMDGVLWRDSEAIGNLPAVFKRINELGLQFVLATNNSTKLVTQYQQKLQDFGVLVSENQIATSGQAVVYHLQQKYPQSSPIYVVGMDSLVRQIENAGFLISQKNAVAVVVGLDRHISYEKLNIASRLIRHGAEFIGTNPDKTFPTPEGLVPGAGAIIAAVATSAGIEPIIVGKPGHILMDLSLSRLSHGSRNQVLMVGDRPDTDIAAGIAFGCRTALVLSGVTDAQSAETDLPKPDYVFKDLSALLGLN